MGDQMHRRGTSGAFQPVPTQPKGEPASNQPCDCWFSRNSLWICEWFFLVVLAVIEAFVTNVHPHHRFIPLNDPSIAYPLVTETVPTAMLIGLTVPLPFLIVSGVHLCDFFRNSKGEKRLLIVYRYHTVIRLFLLALVTNVLFTDLVKKYIGRPRPNFIALAGYSVDPVSGRANFTAPEADQREAFQSFLSGHASLSMCSLLYLSQYFAERFRHHSTRVVEFLCWIPVLFAAWIGLTRCLDYYHNFDDVIGGTILGACVAFFYYPHPHGSIPSFYDYSGSITRKRRKEAMEAIKEGTVDAEIPVPLVDDHEKEKEDLIVDGNVVHIFHPEQGSNEEKQNG